jgi:ParB family chromosome partitioning protein
VAKNALGRGLDALLADAEDSPAARQADSSAAPRLPQGITQNKDGVFFAPIEKLIPNPHQPRREFDQASLDELADSIRQHGVIQAVTIEAAEDGNFIIIAGERRTRAAKLAGLAAIPIQLKKYTDNKKLEIALIENIQREDLNPLEEARAYSELMLLNNISQEETAKRVGKKRSTVANALRLLRLPDNMQKALADGSLSAGHARALLSIAITEAREALFEKIILEGITVREAEAAAQKISEGGISGSQNSLSGEKQKAVPKEDARDADLIAIEQKLINTLGTKVSIKGDFDKGALLVEYFSRDDLDRVYEIITGGR